MGFTNNDGSGLVGGLLPSSVGQALALDSSGNLKTNPLPGGNAVTNPCITEDQIRAWIIAGQCFAASVTNTTIAATGHGDYILSIFNPAGSGKNILVFSSKISNNYSLQTIGNLILTTIDPSLTTTPNLAAITPANLKAGASSPASVASVSGTNSTTPTSWYASNVIDTSLLSIPEMLTNGVAIALPPGNGFVALTYVGDLQEYAIAAKWIEY